MPFGPEWADVDRNGCDTRNDILRRDLDPVDGLKPGTRGCVVPSADRSPTRTAGETIAFERGYDTCDRWCRSTTWCRLEQRLAEGRPVVGCGPVAEQFANDPLNLLAVDGPLNLQKGDGDAATWLPPERLFWCEYVARQVAVKSKYGLWVTPPERDAILRVLTRCPGSRSSRNEGAGRHVRP